MEPQLAILASCLAIAISLIVILGKLAGIIAQLTLLQFKVDIMWEGQLRRGIAEGVNKGVLTVNSPVKISKKAIEWFNKDPELVKDLQEFYLVDGHKLAKEALALEIEHRFGERLIKSICIPNNLFSLSCILAAIAIAKNEEYVMECPDV